MIRGGEWNTRLPWTAGPVAESRTVYRFVRVPSVDDEALADDFVSDRVTGKRPLRREKAYPELTDGMSVFGSLGAARAERERIRAAAEKRGQEVRIGAYVAEVELLPDHGCSLEDLGEPDEHLTIWGNPAQLAGAVRRIISARIETETE